MINYMLLILLINVKMPTINIFEHDKLHAQLSWAWKKFYNLGARYQSDINIPVFTVGNLLQLKVGE